MPLADLEINSGIACVKMKNGVTNALSPELIADLFFITQKIKKDATAVILTGNEKFFSLGFDLPKIIGFDMTNLATFLDDFQHLLFDWATLPIPAIAALCGHAVAGGAILSIVCDYRIAKSEKMKIGFNESLLGLSIPFLAELMLQKTVGMQTAHRLLVEGMLIDSSKALSIGLVDGICPEENIMEWALKKIRSLGEIPANTFCAIKKNQMEAIREIYLAKAQQRTRQFIDLWFTKETQQKLSKALEKF